MPSTLETRPPVIILDDPVSKEYSVSVPEEPRRGFESSTRGSWTNITYKKLAMILIPASLLVTLAVALPVCLAADACGAKSSSKVQSSAKITSTTSSRAASATGIAAPAKTVGLDSTFIYELDHNSVSSPSITSSSGVKINANVYIVDMANTSKDQIAKYKSDGKTVICYFSAGTWEPGRTDAKAFDPSCVCKGAKLSDTACSTKDNKMADWNEWWLDIHSASCIANVENVMTARIQAAAAKGCDGVDPDNVDSYINADEQKHGNTQLDQVNYLSFLSKTARANKLLVDLKNGGDLLQGQYKDQIVKAFDFNVIEQCHKYNECDVYQSFLDAGKPNFQIEYGNISKCPSLKKGQHLLVYSEDTLDTSKITRVC